VGALGASAGTWQQAGDTIADALANTDATPGGGSAAGISGAMGCGLGMMAVGITLKSKKLDAAKRPGLEAALAAFAAFKAEFKSLTSEDAASFDAFMAAMSLPKEDPSRAGKMQQALIGAAEVPLRTAQTAGQAYELARKTAPSCGPAVASDVNCAMHLLRAAALCAAENVRINLGGIKDGKTVADLTARLDAALKPVGELAVR
jgi:methenyltetrahydrofolate cyclohydrolase